MSKLRGERGASGPTPLPQDSTILPADLGGQVWLGSSHSGAEKVLQQVREQRIQQWIYLGKPGEAQAAWQERLAPLTEIDLGEVVNRKAWELRQPYADWVAELGRPYGESLAWWSTELAEKNTGNSDLFLHLCYLEAAAEVLAPGAAPVLLLCEDWAVFVTLARWLPGRGLRLHLLESPARRYGLEAIREALKFLGHWGKGLLTLAGQLLAARRTRSWQRPLPLDPGRPRVLLHTCIDEACLGKDGKFRDRYFSRLPKWLRDRGYDVVTMVWPYQVTRSPAEAFRWFRQNKANFLIPEDYFRLRDYPGAILTLFRGLRLPGRAVRFRDKDVGLLVARERWRQGCATSKLRFLLYAPMAARLKKAGWRIDVFVDMFENMGVEKPLTLALRRSYPQARLLGFQHATINPFMLKYMVTPEEFRRAKRLFPDTIICNGPGSLKLLKANGFPKEPLRVGPALRYLYLWEKSGRTAKPQAEKQVLVVLPMKPDLARAILHKTLVALKGLPYKILFKPHPMLAREYLENALGPAGLPAGAAWIEGSMADCLKEAGCVVGTATAALLEAVLAGIPVVIWGIARELDMNPLAWWQAEHPMFRSLYRVEDVRRAVQDWLAISPAARLQKVESARALLGACFHPWDEAVLKEIFFERDELH
jgi:hypothetical protein